MKNRAKYLFHSGLVLIVVLTLLGTAIACGSGSTSTSTSTSSTSSTSTTPVTLVSISVAPSAPANLNVGGTQQFTAAGTYSNNSTKDISSQVAWATSNTNIASVSASGLVTGVAAGTVTISATLSGVTSSPVSLTVIPVATLSSIAVTPAAPAGIKVDVTVQFTATGTYSDGTTKDITSSVVWATSDPNIAKISAFGVARSYAVGSVTITASLSGVTSPPVTLTVIPQPVLSSIAVTPATPANLRIGSTQQFTATGTYADGSTSTISTGVAWAVSDSNIATISTSGQARGVAAGTVTITASASGITSLPVTLIVVPVPALSSIAITPSSPPNLAVGSSLQFTATGTYADGSKATISTGLTWTSSNPNVAAIYSGGLAVGIAAGSVTITASLSGITSPPVNLTVTTS